MSVTVAAALRSAGTRSGGAVRSPVSSVDMASSLHRSHLETTRPAFRGGYAVARRTRARRTGWLFGGIAVAIYVAFILSGVIGR